MRVRFGERVEHDGRKAPLVAPTELWGDAAKAEAALRAWRSARAAKDGVPAYVVVNDKHLRGIALARPTTPADLVACDGIGPAKLERYGDDILEVLEPFA
jgi:superfamily II DNA helicase RecQ